MEQKLKIVLITGDGLEHHYVANKLSASIDLAAIIVDEGKQLTRVERLRRLWKRYTLRQSLGRLGLRLLKTLWGYKSERSSQVLAVLGEADCADFRRRHLVVRVKGINTGEGQRLVASFDPDVILVFGTSVIGKKILGMAHHTALNMHTGISPNYRGADCYFWPVHNQELDMIGATVHECTAQLDAGEIYDVTSVKLQAEDRLFSVFARCVAAGADLYVQVVKELIAGRLQGKQQDLGSGREYKAAMRGLVAEWKVRRLINTGLISEHVQRAGEQKAVTASVSNR